MYYITTSQLEALPLHRKNKKSVRTDQSSLI